MDAAIKWIGVIISTVGGILAHRYTYAIDTCNDVIAHSNSATEKRIGRENIAKFTKRRRLVYLIWAILIILLLIIYAYVD